MRSPDEVRSQMEAMWARQWVNWVCGDGAWPIPIPLGLPTQTKAVAAWDRLCEWRSSWNAQSNIQTNKTTKRWGGLGTQEIPTHAVFPSASAVAIFLGENKPERFQRAQVRWRSLVGQWPDSVIARRIVPWLADTSNDDFDRAVRAAAWLNANPNSDLYIRQLPIAGLDSKWIEKNRDIVLILLSAHRGEPLSGRLETIAGLREDRPKCRFRILDPVLRAKMCGLGDVSAPIEDLIHLSIDIRVVIVVENLQTALACGDLPETLVFFGAGFHAPSLAIVPWLHKSRLLYWGDLDTAGFEILNAMRAVFPHAESFGMDEATLLAHRDLWGPDPKQRAADLTRLSPSELTAYRLLFDGAHGIRMEQERISWARAWQQLCQQISP